MAEDPRPDDLDDRDEPDPSLVWRWVKAATEPLVGWILVAIGVVAIILGWVGASRQVFPAQQIPYLISGGLLGVSLIFLGGILVGIQDMRQAADRLNGLERKVDDLHEALLDRSDAPTLDASTNGSAPPAETVAVLPDGTSFHRLDCPVVSGKDGVDSLAVSAARDRGLAPCKLCDPLGSTERATTLA